MGVKKKRASQLRTNLWKAPKAFLWYSSCVLLSDAKEKHKHTGTFYSESLQLFKQTFRNAKHAGPKQKQMSALCHVNNRYLPSSSS